MKLLKLGSLLFLLLTSFSVCNAQDKKPKKTAEQKSTEQAKKLDKDLKLTKDQFVKVKSINNVYLQKKGALDAKIDAFKKEKDKLKKIVMQL